jgi:hypothetical protein
MEMVVVARVGTRFEADLLAAKLGAHGVLWEIRSRQLLPTTHPIGSLDLLVPAGERELAAEILAPDELPVLDDQGRTVTVGPRAGLTPAMKGLRVALALGLLVPIAVALVLWVADALRFLDVVRS